jgi:PEP-CTERM motif
MKSIAIATVIAAASAFTISNSASAAPFPAINGHTPGFVITLGPGGTSNVAPTGQGPYDGIEDTYIGVVNNSGGPVPSIPISSTLQIFSFDGDGIDTFGITKNAGNTDTTGYGGPNGFFTGVNGALTAGTVNFSTPIPNLGQDFFSVELDIAGAGGGINVGAVPEPGTWAMMLIGFAGLGFLSYRKSKQRNNVLVQA